MMPRSGTGKADSTINPSHPERPAQPGLRWRLPPNERPNRIMRCGAGAILGQIAPEPPRRSGRLPCSLGITARSDRSPVVEDENGGCSS